MTALRGVAEALRLVGLGLSPEYVYEIRGVEMFPDNRRFGVLWMGREALGALFDMPGAFNDLAVALAPAMFSGIMVAGRIRKLDLVAVLKTRE